MYPCVNRNAGPNNNKFLTHYLPVCYLLRIQQYPVKTTYNTYTKTGRMSNKEIEIEEKSEQENLKQLERERERERGRERDRQTDRERETDRERDRERQTERETDRERDRYTM